MGYNGEKYALVRVEATTKYISIDRGKKTKIEITIGVSELFLYATI